MPRAFQPADLELLGEVARVAAKAARLRLVVLFGSAARGEPRPEDFDVGVLADEPVDLVALTNELTRSLGRQQVDLTDLRVASPVLLALAAREGVPLYEHKPGEFARFASLAIRRFADTRKFRQAQADLLAEFADRQAGRQ